MLLIFLGFWLTLGASAAPDDKVITCHGYGGFAYLNNTRCPGSNTCCGVDATCLSNRLCHKPNDGPNTFLRGPCAINPYDSGTCAQICLYNETTGYLPRVNVCSDGSLCCDNDSHCCDNKKGVFLDNDGKITDSAPSTTYSYGPERTAATFRMSVESATSSINVSATGDPSSTGAPPSSTPSSVSNSEDKTRHGSGLAIGLGVGITVASILAIGAAFWFWRKKRDAKNQTSQPSPRPGTSEAFRQDYWNQANKAKQPDHGSAENALNNVTRYELPASHKPAELDAGYR